MNKKINFFKWFNEAFKLFLTESINNPQYEIVDIFECKETGLTKAVVKLSGSHVITKNISDIVVDTNFIEGFDKKTIRTLTYMATLEKMNPHYSVISQSMSDVVDEYILEIKSKNNGIIIKKTPSELLKDKSILSKLSPLEANRIGYLAGVRETVKEYEISRS